MSVKITVSYETKEELYRVLKLLHPAISFWKMAAGRKGRYCRVYITLKPFIENEKQ